MTPDERMLFRELVAALRHQVILNRELTGVIVDLQTRIPAAQKDDDVESADDMMPAHVLPGATIHNRIEPQRATETMKHYQ